MDKKKLAAMLALCMTFGTTAPAVTQAADPEAAAVLESASENGDKDKPAKEEAGSETAEPVKSGAAEDTGSEEKAPKKEAPAEADPASEREAAPETGAEASGGAENTGSEEKAPEKESPAETEAAPETEGAAETEAAPETEGAENIGSEEKAPEKETETAAETEAGAETDTAAETEAGAETETAAETEAAAETTEEEQLPEVEDNQEEIELAADFSKFAIVSDYWLPSLHKEFRLTWQQDAPRGILFPGTLIYESQSKDSRPVGWSTTGSVVTILADAEEDWIFVESGKVRGFISREDLLSSELTAFILEQGDLQSFGDARALVTPMDNRALLYTMTTGTDPVVEGEPAVALEQVSIFDSVSLDPERNQIVGELPVNGYAAVLERVNEEIFFVESGDVRGFVAADQLLMGEAVQPILDAEGEILATEMMAPEENKALYFTITSVREADEDTALRADIIEFARQFLGCAYVWGGNELGVGVDCSGFMQQIFRRYGVELPRTSCRQAEVGEKIAVNEAKPGDLIFYQTGGVIHHVAMYIGEGQVIHARGRKYGIVIGSIARNAAWAVDVLAALK